MPMRYVKPYVKTNKSDYIDAEAIAEAVGRPKMRFVPIKSDGQLDLQSLHRVRERWVMRRTAVMNQILGLLLERGITLRQGRRHIDAALPGTLRASPHSGSARTRARATTVSRLKGLPILVCRVDRKDNNFVQKPIAPGVKLQRFGDTTILLFR
jgi:transposase